MCESSCVKPRGRKIPCSDSRALVAVDGPELREPQRQIAVRARPRLVDQDVERTVHRLEVVVALLRLDRRVHAVGELREVAGGLPEHRLADVRRRDDLVAAARCGCRARSPRGSCGPSRPSGATRRDRPPARAGTRTGRGHVRACGGRAARPPRGGAGSRRALPASATPSRRSRCSCGRDSSPRQYAPETRSSLTCRCCDVDGTWGPRHRSVNASVVAGTA